MDGLEDLESDLKFAMQEYPTEMRKGLRKVANEFKKSCKERTPDGNTSKKPAEKLRRKFGVKTKKDGDQYIALVYNSAYHFHLVEYGHNLVRDGKVIGFVPGKHMMEQTRNEYRDVIPGRFEKICDEVLNNHNL
jgi:hypothetical protein